MSHEIIEKFIETHYKPVNLQEKRAIKYLPQWIKSKLVYKIAEGRSSVLISEGTNNDLEILVLDQSQTDFEISLPPNNIVVQNYQGSSLEENYPNVFFLKACGNGKLNASYRDMTIPLSMATIFGDTDRLNSEEIKYYNEFVGKNLPVDFDVLNSFSFGIAPDCALDKEFNEFFREWASNRNHQIQVYDTFRNGSLHYHIRDNRFLYDGAKK